MIYFILITFELYFSMDIYSDVIHFKSFINVISIGLHFLLHSLTKSFEKFWISWMNEEKIAVFSFVNRYVKFYEMYIIYNCSKTIYENYRLPYIRLKIRTMIDRMIRIFRYKLRFTVNFETMVPFCVTSTVLAEFSSNSEFVMRERPEL